MSNPIAIIYSDEKLRVLVEEYITQQRTSFTLKGVCSYVLYWAMEDGKTDKGSHAIYENDQLSPKDCDRIKEILEKIVAEGRITTLGKDDFLKALSA